MRRNFPIVITFLIFIGQNLYSQLDSLPTTQQLKEIILSSSRIDLPLKENSRTVQFITAEELKKSGVLTIVEGLQLLSGIDIRQRGIVGMQADLYIRGGSFDQTLLLIDGIKLDDAQTGHHTLNFLPPLEMVERIEIVKGPAARIFGQNAFTGAINIVTKQDVSKGGKLAVHSGSFGQLHGEITLQNGSEKGSYSAHFSRNTSDGYRYNTDFKNNNLFFKAQLFKQKKLPINLIANFSGRKFGANGFYASPEAVDQYEETEAGILALQSKIQQGSWNLEPRLYWRRGQDHYLYLRNRPEVYENWHITHKLGAAFDATYASSFGLTGMGVDVARVSIASNNLGYRERFLAMLFVEQRFNLFDGVLNLTPGVAVNSYSDFGLFAYPGLDLGLNLSPQWLLYGNLGYTYRIPTYTDLFYEDRTTLGNPDLKPEEALSKEVGIRYSSQKLRFYAAFFDRRATNLIDYVKPSETDLWRATNIRELITTGAEVELSFPFRLSNSKQNIQFGYTHLIDDLEAPSIAFSRYSINSLKHHVTFRYSSQITKKLSTFLGIKHAQRTGTSAYTVMDWSLDWQLKSFELRGSVNNLLNASYSETNLVPMPGRNLLISVSYRF
jgi:iron complex outermembrane receptor protein